MAMMIADGSPKGGADPAFEAHGGVIGHWAQAVWYTWLRTDQLQCMIDAAVASTSVAQQPWRLCTALQLPCFSHVKESSGK